MSLSALRGDEGDEEPDERGHGAAGQVAEGAGGRPHQRQAQPARGPAPTEHGRKGKSIQGRDSQEKKIIEKIIEKLIEKFLEIFYTRKMDKLE